MRGMGQVFFMDKPHVGAIILLGLLVADAWLALYMVAGIVVGTLAASAMRISRESIGAGLHGYCAALVGGAAYTTWGDGFQAWLSVLIGGVAVVPVTVVLATLLKTPGIARLGLPVLTAPFCIASGVIAVVARTVQPAAVAPSGPEEVTWTLFVKAVFTGIGQVVFADSATAGAIILAALFIASWRAGTAALLAAVTTTTAAAVFRLSPTPMAHGLDQYSAVLVGIAVAAVFLADVRPTWVPWAVTVVGSLATMAVSLALQATPIPVYTWPFILVTWAIIAVRAMVESLPGYVRSASSSGTGSPVAARLSTTVTTTWHRPVRTSSEASVGQDRGVTARH